MLSTSLFTTARVKKCRLKLFFANLLDIEITKDSEISSIRYEVLLDILPSLGSAKSKVLLKSRTFNLVTEFKLKVLLNYFSLG